MSAGNGEGDRSTGRPRPSLERVTGARVQRVDGPEPGKLYALTLEGGRAREVLVLRVDGGAPGVGLVPTRPKGQAAGAFVRRLRKTLVGARLAEFEAAPGWLGVRWDTRDGQVALRLPVPPSRARGLVLMDDAGRVLAVEPVASLRALGVRPGQAFPEVGTGSWSASPAGAPGPLRAEGARLLRSAADEAGAAAVAALRKRVVRTRRRLARKLEAIDGDLARADDAPSLRHRADLLLASPDATPDASGMVTVEDWSADPPRPIRLALEPGHDRTSQAARWFHRARRIERGAGIAAERRTATNAALTAVEAFLEGLDARSPGDPPSPDELAALEKGWLALGVDRRVPSRPQRSHGRKAAPARLPYKSFRGAGDREIRVGRGAADNDALTLQHARPQDAWLHARSVRGAHVVVPKRRGDTLPAELLVDAAMLAAHFSEASGEAIVEVQHTERRHVRKPKGIAVGAVLVDREKTIAVRTDAARLRELLESEKPPGP